MYACLPLMKCVFCIIFQYLMLFIISLNFKSIVDTLLSREALRSLVVNGRKATTSLVESVHKEIRLPVPKGRVYRKNETRLIKSGDFHNKQS